MSSWESAVKLGTKTLHLDPLRSVWPHGESMLASSSSHQHLRDLSTVLEQIMLRKGDADTGRMITRYFRIGLSDDSSPDPAWINLNVSKELCSEGFETIPEQLHNQHETSKASCSLSKKSHGVLFSSRGSSWPEFAQEQGGRLK